MLDLIMIICIIIMAISGLAYQFLPADKLVKKEKLKNGETMEEATKRIRKSGLLYLGLAVLFFVMTFVM